MSTPATKRYLTADDFRKGLDKLDQEMDGNEMLGAFAPIEIMSAGGFVAVAYLQNREATGDLDYVIAPEWIGDEEILTPLKEAMLHVGMELEFHRDWINDDMSIWITRKTHETLFEQARVQDIALYRGRNLIVWAAPVEWALERKIRRIGLAQRGRKREFDISDAVALLRHIRDAKGVRLLDMEKIRTLNANGFDPLPNGSTMDLVREAYREKYGEDIFM